MVLGKGVLGEQLEEEDGVEDVLKDEGVRVFVVLQDLGGVVAMRAAGRVRIVDGLDGARGLLEVRDQLLEEHRVPFLGQQRLLVLLILYILASSLLRPHF